ncbi:hypothetical protein A9Q81_11760 [Gammaproteobacteria bacterium 42_54_T18]|nr:hypothetical protein A9Q81_11760 [Gammaproteobacteria bacterium 42_54_T18]
MTETERIKVENQQRLKDATSILEGVLICGDYGVSQSDLAGLLNELDRVRKVSRDSYSVEYDEEG